MRADRASWDLKSMLGCEFLAPQVGKKFEGVVTGVTEFGLFIEIDPWHLDGLVHISELGRDYFIYDRQMHRLVGRRNGRAFAIGDTVSVRLESVRPEERKTDFSLVQ